MKSESSKSPEEPRMNVPTSVMSSPKGYAVKHQNSTRVDSNKITMRSKRTMSASQMVKKITMPMSVPSSRYKALLKPQIPKAKKVEKKSKSRSRSRSKG